MEMVEVMTASLAPDSPNFGVETNSAIEAQEIDVVILETQIKGGTCIKTASLLRRYNQLVPIICLLTTVSNEDHQGLQQLHDAYILPKPFHTNALKCILREALYRPQNSPPAQSPTQTVTEPPHDQENSTQISA